MPAPGRGDHAATVMCVSLRLRRSSDAGAQEYRKDIHMLDGEEFCRSLARFDRHSHEFARIPQHRHDSPGHAKGRGLLFPMCRRSNFGASGLLVPGIMNRMTNASVVVSQDRAVYEAGVQEE